MKTLFRYRSQRAWENPTLIWGPHSYSGDRAKGAVTHPRNKQQQQRKKESKVLKA